MPSEWRVGFYQDRRGRKPVKEFLDELGQQRPDTYAVVVEKIRIVEEIGYQEACSVALLKPVTGHRKIVELKPSGTDVRLLMFRWRNGGGHKLLLLAAHDVKKQNKLDPKAIKAAEAACRDWYERYGKRGG